MTGTDERRVRAPHTAYRHRVVVTGMGIASPLGNSVESFWQALMAGGSAFELHDELGDALVARVPDDGWEQEFSGATRRYTDRCTRLALHAARQAVQQSGLPPRPRTELRRRRADDDAPSVLPGSPLAEAGVYVGSSIGGISSIWADFRDCARAGSPQEMTPSVLPRSLINMISANVSIDLGSGGEALGFASACASGTVALGEAYRKVATGLVPIAVAGGAESCVIPTVMTPFQKVGAMTRSTDPRRAVRPFARDRDGFVMGEGAAMLVLETRDAALARGAELHGEIVGFHATSDAVSLLAPDVDGVRRALKGLFGTSALDPADVVYVNAHGTATVLNDDTEARAIAEVLPHRPWVSSTKASYGHPLGAAGAFEAVVCVEALARGRAPGTVGLRPEDVDPAMDLRLATGSSVPLRPGGVALSTSLAFGGQNAVLAFG